MEPTTRTQTELTQLIAKAYRLGNYGEAMKLETELASLQMYTL